MSYPAEEDELVDGLLSEGVGRIDMMRSCLSREMG